MAAMIRFSDDPNFAERQMEAVIFYLTTFGYIDGDFDTAEKVFVRKYIADLVSARADAALAGQDPSLKRELAQRYTAHFHEVFEGVDRSIQELFTEAVADGEDQATFVRTKLKTRCFEIFQKFDGAGQEALLSSLDALLEADGVAHPAELEFRAELGRLLHTAVDVSLLEEDPAPELVKVDAPMEVPSSGLDHGFFQSFERHYSPDPARVPREVSEEMALLDRVEKTLSDKRRAGEGRLAKCASFQDVPEGSTFLDGHIYVQKPKAGEPYELLVLGDLHGCYSVLKAAVMQSRFFEKVDAYRTQPKKNPAPYLVLLGDYIDRGMFSLNGVLRAALQLCATAPDHVFMLRGNHEYYVEVNGTVYGGVKPAEAINTLRPHWPIDVFRRYLRFFETMPSALLFDRMCFVHAGIPRETTIKAKWKNLASLNDADLRFQMMWSDPSTADLIPPELQEKSARFPFGRLQAKAFLSRIGCHTLVRGHEKVNEGFRVVYDEPHMKLFTLFSAGGKQNADLPANSSYRTVTPMALSIVHDGSVTTLRPWAPDYVTYNDPTRNAFFREPPAIPHRAD